MARSDVEAVCREWGRAMSQPLAFKISKSRVPFFKNKEVRPLTAAYERDDMPGLHGLCVEAIRSAERHGR